MKSLSMYNNKEIPTEFVLKIMISIVYVPTIFRGLSEALNHHAVF